MNETDALHNISYYRLAKDIDTISVPIYTTFGIVGNILSFIVLVSSSLIRSTTCLYMVVIAVLDTTILIINVVLKVPDFIHTKNIPCKTFLSIFYFSIHYVTLLIVTMTLERYIVVRYPLQATAWITRGRTKKVICFIGLFSSLLNAHQLFIREVVVQPRSGTPRCLYTGEMNVFFMTKVYPWIDAFLYSFFPTISLFILNILIIKSLRSSRNFMDKLETKGVARPKQQKQVTLMLVLISVAFLLFAGPMGTMLILTQYAWFPETDLEYAKYHLVQVLAINLMYINHALNFILYVVSGHKFRKELRRLFCRLCICKRSCKSTQVPVRQRQIYIFQDRSSD